jgi:hypothetical protein
MSSERDDIPPNIAQSNVGVKEILRKPIFVLFAETSIGLIPMKIKRRVHGSAEILLKESCVVINRLVGRAERKAKTK